MIPSGFLPSQDIKRNKNGQYLGISRTIPWNIGDHTLKNIIGQMYENIHYGQYLWISRTVPGNIMDHTLNITGQIPKGQFPTHRTMNLFLFSTLMTKMYFGNIIVLILRFSLILSYASPNIFKNNFQMWHCQKKSDIIWIMKTHMRTT